MAFLRVKKILEKKKMSFLAHFSLKQIGEGFSTAVAMILIKSHSLLSFYSLTDKETQAASHDSLGRPIRASISIGQWRVIFGRSKLCSLPFEHLCTLLKTFYKSIRRNRLQGLSTRIRKVFVNLGSFSLWYPDKNFYVGIWGTRQVLEGSKVTQKGSNVILTVEMTRCERINFSSPGKFILQFNQKRFYSLTILLFFKSEKRVSGVRYERTTYVGAVYSPHPPNARTVRPF